MARWFNIGGPCNPTDNYMLSATARLPEVVSLISKKQYFVVHAPRQCGKTTAFRALADEINAKGEKIALYCSVEAVQEFTDPVVGTTQIAALIRDSVRCASSELLGGLTEEELMRRVGAAEPTNIVKRTLNELALVARKPLIMFFDEVDCLSDGTLVSFLRQLRDGRISCSGPNVFPVSMALIGLRNIRDYKMRIRPEGQSAGEASPFNVITEAMTIRLFTEEEMRTLYRQHTDETGQAFAEEALAKAWEFSQGQPYLVNALARWCVEKIHREDFTQPVTGADMEEAKEKLIRERGTHLDSLMEKCYDPRIRPLVEPALTGGSVDPDVNRENIAYALDLGLFVDERGVLKPANPIYRETIGRYMTRGTQDQMRATVPETPWVREDGLDMSGLLAAFQQFWRENATPEAFLAQYREAYPHLVLQAFLQRVVNGGGSIIREMALGSERLDLGVLFRGAKYAVEVKTAAYYAKSHAKAYDQVRNYMDKLGVDEGWLVVADADLAKPWEEKIGWDEIVWKGRPIHLVRC